jgi:hypothetical protein
MPKIPLSASLPIPIPTIHRASFSFSPSHLPPSLSHPNPRASHRQQPIIWPLSRQQQTSPRPLSLTSGSPARQLASRSGADDARPGATWWPRAPRAVHGGAGADSNLAPWTDWGPQWRRRRAASLGMLFFISFPLLISMPL